MKPYKDMGNGEKADFHREKFAEAKNKFDVKGQAFHKEKMLHFASLGVDDAAAGQEFGELASKTIGATVDTIGETVSDLKPFAFGVGGVVVLVSLGLLWLKFK